MATKEQIDLASKACVLLGAAQINSFEEETTEGLAVRTFYEMVYGTLIQHRNWTFAKKTLPLKQLDEPAEYGFKYVYRLDVDIVKLISLQNTASNYTLASKRKIHTDIPNAFATCLIRPDEELLPESFKLAFVYMLAGAMATTITDDSSQTARFEDKGALLIKQAATIDAVQSGNLSYSTSSDLLNAHNGGY